MHKYWINATKKENHEFTEVCRACISFYYYLAWHRGEGTVCLSYYNNTEYKSCLVHGLIVRTEKKIFLFLSKHPQAAATKKDPSYLLFCLTTSANTFKTVKPR